MTGPVFSASWYRVSGLTPRLRSHARIHRHQYRGETWYVLQDLASDRMHRFSPAGYLIIGLMDGRRTVEEIWNIATERLGDDAPTQDEMIQLLSQLQVADVLQCEVPPDTAELLRRYEERQRRTAWSRWSSPFSWRFSLCNPEPFLRACLPVVRPFFGIAGALVWLAVVTTGVVLVSVHWTDLSKDLLDRLLIPGNAVVLWLVFPLIKTVHEFGHAFAVKAFGGEVHDMGVMILVFTPIPYVDASSASAFRSKWQRIAVGGAGMAVELFVATGALVLWISAEPGLARLVAYNVIMIAGISTLLFNANPLLRYDGYYMLADLLEIPNLYTRSRAWVYYLVERHLFGRREAEPPPSTSGERAWFVLYAVTSFLYRAFVVAAIALFVIQRVFYIGILLAGAALLAWTAVPAAKGVSYLFTSPRLRQVRARAILVTVAVVALVVGAVGFVPVPFRTRAEGVVWIPDEAFVRAETEGFVDRVVARPGARVRRGDVLAVLRDPMLVVQGRVLEARMRELQARYDSLVPTDRVKTQIVLEEMKATRQELGRALERLRGLTVRSGADGTFVLPLAENLPGRFAKKGELLGHVVDVNTITVRTVVAQADADLVRHRLHAIEVRLSERLAEPFPAALKREVPGGSAALPSPALGSTGGGAVAVDPRDERGTTAMQKIFQVDLELPSALKLVNVGGRVYVRFDHGREPLAVQWYRELRQLFLARFNV